MFIKGILEKILYHDKEKGYGIFSFRNDESKRIICCGHFPLFVQNTPLMLEGDFTFIKGEERFIIKKISFYQNNTEKNIRFLNALLPTCSIKTISEIAEFLPQNYLEICKNRQYEEISKLRTKTTEENFHYIQQIYKKITNLDNQMMLFEDVISVGGNYNAVLKLIEKYDSNAYYELKKNPYKSGYYAGINFLCCEYLAQKYGFAGCDDIRIRAIGQFCLNQNEKMGNVYLTVDDLKNYLEKINSLNIYPDKIPLQMILMDLIANNNVHIDDKHIYNKSTWNEQSTLIRDCERLQGNARKVNHPYTDIYQIEKEIGLKLSEEQKKCLSVTEANGIHIITGGPGTGKTTVIKAILKKFKKEYPQEEFCLCAPTGRAAQKITENSGFQAYTINKLINFVPFENTENYKIMSEELRYKLVIIDEFSMASLKLTSLLFSVIRDDAIVICVGDVDQLPSVEPGRVLEDFISSGCFPVFKLNYVYRQDNEHKSIVENAYKINNKNINFLLDHSFSVRQIENHESFIAECNKEIKELYKSQNVYFKHQVLTPMKKQTLGVYEINKLMQNSNRAPHIRYGANCFFINDKIIITKTNYDKGYFNGDIGKITDVCDTGLEIELQDGTYVEIQNSDLDELMPAYAVTVHKSQGSEYDEVLIILSKDASSMFTIKLLYTAITRAKKKVSIIAEGNALKNVIESPANLRKRKSDLSKYLQKL